MDLIPGYLQGLSKMFITYPADVIKIKMQTRNYKNIRDCFKNILKKDKYIFFRGIKLPLLTFPIERAISYKIFEDLNKKNHNPYVSSIFSSLIGSFVNVPVQFFTTNAINMKKSDYSNISNLIKENLKNKNNFYKGYFIETSRSVTGSVIFLGTYGNLRNILKNKSENHIAISSILSISLTWLLTFPLDTIRVEKQITNETIREIINRRHNRWGFFHFYKGITPVLIRSFPSTLIGMYVYEYSRDLVNNSLE